MEKIKKQAKPKQHQLQEAALKYELPDTLQVVKGKKNGSASKTIGYIKKSVSILGKSTLELLQQVQSHADFIQCIREGIPRKALDELIQHTGLTIEEITSVLDISDRTLRRYSAQQKLSSSQTERLIEIAQLYSRGEEVFGSLESFKIWMNSLVPALGNIKPKTLLDTSIGIGLLMNELGKIEHGIFA